MKFSKIHSGSYQATRKDGQVINIYKIEEPCPLMGDLWASSYEGDFHGHNNSAAKTKRELVAIENRIEEHASDEDLKNSNYM
mgnify:CR=1 FL=1